MYKKITSLLTTITILLAGNIKGKLITSGEVEIKPGKTNIFIAIPKNEGYISITNANWIFCKLSVRNNKGKILAILSNLNMNPEVKVKSHQIYYIYAKANNPKQCKNFEIFIP